MYRVIKASLQSFAQRIAQARRKLKMYDPEKVQYMEEMYQDYISEAAKMNRAGDFIGDPSGVKRDWASIAVEDGIMTPEEFDEIFQLLDIVHEEDSMPYC